MLQIKFQPPAGVCVKLDPVVMPTGLADQGLAAEQDRIHVGRHKVADVDLRANPVWDMKSRLQDETAPARTR